MKLLWKQILGKQAPVANALLKPELERGIESDPVVFDAIGPQLTKLFPCLLGQCVPPRNRKTRRIDIQGPFDAASTRLTKCCK